MNKNKDEYLFYAEITKGNTFKVLIDTLANIFPKTTFKVDENGFYHRKKDEKDWVLFDVEFPRNNFLEFHCQNEFYFMVDLKHLQRMVKTIKKKDNLVIFIDNDEYDDKYYFNISIGQSSSNTNLQKVEMNGIVIRVLNIEDEDDTFEDIYDENLPDDIDDDDIIKYNYNMSIPSSDFSKVKKMSSLCKYITIGIQGNNYATFKYGSDIVYKQKIEFGNIVHNEDGDCENYYEEEFNKDSITSLTKLCGLCDQINFYAPYYKYSPLKIELSAGKLGTVKIFVKDQMTIQHDKDMNE